MERLEQYTAIADVIIGAVLVPGRKSPYLVDESMVKAMKHDVFANYLKSAGLTPDDSVAGWDVWDKHLKEEYQVAAEALKELGLMEQ